MAWRFRNENQVVTPRAPNKQAPLKGERTIRLPNGPGVAIKHMGRRLLGLFFIVLLIGSSTLWAFRNVGRLLVVEDPLQHARAVVILSGVPPYRAIEAAKIYRQGWAPEVWLFTDDSRETDKAFAGLGIHHISEAEYDQQVLQRLGVPKAAIRILEPLTTNTASELLQIGRELKNQAAAKVILVTSPVHTRRSRLIWRLVVGEHPQAILRHDDSEPTDPQHWWRTTRDVEAVEHEVLGLIDARLGFTVKPGPE